MRSMHHVNPTECSRCCVIGWCVHKQLNILTNKVASVYILYFLLYLYLALSCSWAAVFRSRVSWCRVSRTSICPSKRMRSKLKAQPEWLGFHFKVLTKALLKLKNNVNSIFLGTFFETLWGRLQIKCATSSSLSLLSVSFLKVNAFLLCLWRK